MFKIKHYALLLTLIFASISANAEDAKPAGANPFEVKTIAVVDIKRVMDESVASKAAQKEINGIKDKYYAEIKDADKKLQARRKELADQQSAMNADAFKKKVGEFEGRIQQERQEAMKKQKIIEAAFVKSLELIRDETIKIVTTLAKEKNYDLVVPTSQLLYSKSGIDITDEVLKRLNQSLTKVNINIKGADSDSKADAADDKPADSKADDKAAAKPAAKK